MLQKGRTPALVCLQPHSCACVLDHGAEEVDVGLSGKRCLLLGELEYVSELLAQQSRHGCFKVPKAVARNAA